MDFTNNEYLLQQIILDNIHREYKEFLKIFCENIIQVYNLKGAGIAIKDEDHFIIEYCLNITNCSIGQIFSYNASDSVIINEKTNSANLINSTLITDKNSDLIILLNEKNLSTDIHTSITKLVNYLSHIISIKHDVLLLKKENEKYKLVFEKSPLFSIILDVNGNVLEWNTLFTIKYGFSLDKDPISFTEFININELEYIIKIFKNLYSDANKIKKTWNYNKIKNDSAYKEKCYSELDQLSILQESTTFHNKSGDKIFDAEFNVYLNINKETLKINGCIVLMVDTTIRNLYRKKLEESKEKYRELFKLSPFFSMLIDVDGRAVEFNYKSIESYGIKSDFEKITYKDFVFKDDHRFVRNHFIDIYNKAIQVKDMWRKENKISKDECLNKLRKIEIRDAPVRLVNLNKDIITEAEFNASLWIRESDLKINGALITAVNVSERNLYRKKLEESEKKYRELVEEKSRDIIFTLDTQGCFLTVNKNITTKLSYTETILKGKHITEILYDDPIDRNQINKETFTENLDKILKTGLSEIRFNAVCNHKSLGESIILQFKLNPIVENNNIIGVMGFASEISDDPLRIYLLNENLSFNIENKLSIADEISYRITRNLQIFFNENRISLFRIGLREIIVNAIEHGNLGITYKEKSKSQKKQKYHDLLRERQLDPKNRIKRVHIEYSLTNDKVMYTIRDEGPGFDHKKILSKNIHDINIKMLQHGRGILITKSIFDEMIYNDKGNEVYLIAYIKHSKMKQMR